MFLSDSSPNTPLDLNKTIPLLLRKSERILCLFGINDSFQGILHYYHLRHTILQNTDESPISPSYQGWKHLGNLSGCRGKHSDTFVTCQMRQ